jgi:hypothetical protein
MIQYVQNMKYVFQDCIQMAIKEDAIHRLKFEANLNFNCVTISLAGQGTHMHVN